MDILKPATSRNRSPLKFFSLIFAFSLPFWVAGAFLTGQLLPGLPVGALMSFCPLAAAVVFVYRENKFRGVTELLHRSFDYIRIPAKVWYVPIVLLMPGVMALSWWLMQWWGTPVPAPRFALIPALFLLLIFFAAALGEELGWSGYILDPLQNRHGPLQAGILLGLVGALWHIVPLLQAHRSLAWIAGWCLYTVAGRVLIVWIYDHTGWSVFAAAIFHALTNVSWQLFPIDGSYFHPGVTGIIMACLAALLMIVWRPLPAIVPDRL